nr:putative retrotransposon protein [Tanacetum cinerariifolium]
MKLLTMDLITSSLFLLAPAGQQVAPEILSAHTAWVKGSKEIAGIMFMTMKPEIQQNLEPLLAHEMLKELKTLFAQQAEQELLQTTRDFHSCRQEEGQSNYNMHIMGKTANELHVMLKLYEQTLSKSNAPALNAIRAGKDHGIIAHRTPPYTSQHNSVSERRNRTLLDMVRSMMSQTTLPKSFWDYALEIAARILNMVPTKKKKIRHEEEDLEIDEPQSDIVPIRRSMRTRHASDRMCLYIDAEEHELGDHGEPANYKVALLDPDKWLFKKKTDMDGNVHIYKARLVAKGFTQTPGIDYKETFSPVTDIRAIRILIAIAAYYDYKIWQMDVKTAFLNGYLNEEIYMEQPEGFVNLKYPTRVCKLKRSIYRLKQASRQWNRRFDDEIKKFGFTQNRDEPCEKLKLSKSQGASTPAEMKRMQNIPYSSVVGSIMYAVRCTHPDVAFAQNITSRFQQNPGDIHWTTVKNILKYLRNTKDMFLVYGGDLKRELRVSCYTDAGYQTDANDLKSQTGYVFILNGGAVDWKSAKQSIFATSSVEAEYIAAFDASKETILVRKFISGLGVVPTIEEPISMYCDNTGAIATANESGITKSARHFRAKVHYLREVIEFGDIKLEKVHTDDNLADPFRKALAFPKHSKHTKNIGMLPTSSLT